jgi:hypothetical protein
VKLGIGVIGVIAALAAVVVLSTASAADAPNLNGIWKTADGARVRLTQSGNSVTTTFLSGGACPNGAERSSFITGQLNGTTLQGTMMRCTIDQTLLADCNITDPWQTTFTATVSTDSISGTRRTEWYTWDDMVDGHRVNCRRDPSGDSDESFELTRAKCDPELIRKYQLEEEQAALLFEEVRAKLEALHEQNREFLKEQGKEMAIVGGAKGSVVLVLKKAGGKTVNVLIHKAEPFALVYTYYWLAHTVQPEVQDEVLMLNEVDDLLAAAAAKAKQALEDFERDLAQQPECQDEFEKAKAEEAFHDQVKAKMDEWELPGGYLYLDPGDPSGVPMDAGAAFKRAASLLSNGKLPQRQLASAALPNKKKPKPSAYYSVRVKNAKAAVAQMDRGLTGLRKLGKWFKARGAADGGASDQLQPIIQHLHEQAVG